MTFKKAGLRGRKLIIKRKKPVSGWLKLAFGWLDWA